MANSTRKYGYMDLFELNLLYSRWGRGFQGILVTYEWGRMTSYRRACIAFNEI